MNSPSTPHAMTTATALSLEASEESGNPGSGVRLDALSFDGEVDSGDDDPEQDNPDVLAIPDCIVPPSIESKDSRMAVNFWSGDCLDCNSLVQNADNDGETMKCHFSKGNQYCPAREIRVQYIGARMFWLKRVRKAQESGDRSKLLKSLASLDEKADQETRDYVLKEIGL